MLGSLLLHALLLLVDWPQLQQALDRPVHALVPLVARLVEPPAPPPPVPPSRTSKPPSEPEPSKPQPPKIETPKRARPAPPVVEEAAPAARPAPQPAPAPTPAPAVPPPVAPAVPVAPAPPSAPAAEARAAPAPKPPSPAAIETTLIAQYRAALLDQARHYKRYPPVALDNAWEGEVVVRMVIAPDGSLAALSVKASSGHAVLDRRALEMFRKAKPLVPVPQALRGKQFALELRAVFSLRDQVSG